MGLCWHLQRLDIVQPKPDDYDYELDEALASVVGIKIDRPRRRLHGRDARHRAGGARRPRSARTAWCSPSAIWSPRPRPSGSATAATASCRATCWHSTRRPASDWCRRWRRLDLPALPIGSSSETEIGERVVVAGAGGRQRAVAARIIAKQEFAGYWEYVLDEAIFTAPAHPNWGGTALIGPAGDLLGIGSLQIQQALPAAQARGRQHDRADRSAEADPARTCSPSAGPTARRGPGSGSTPPRSAATSPSWDSQAAARRRRRTCAPATSS